MSATSRMANWVRFGDLVVNLDDIVVIFLPESEPAEIHFRAGDLIQPNITVGDDADRAIHEWANSLVDAPKTQL